MRLLPRAAGSFEVVLLTLLCGAVLLLGAGCGDGAPSAASPPEKVAYIESSTYSNRVMLADAGGGDNQPLLDLPGPAEAVTFSNDGRFVAVTLQGYGDRPRAAVAATDGSVSWYLPQDFVSAMSFSPDSSRLAYVSRAGGAAGSGENAIRIFNTNDGASRIIGQTANGLVSSTWVNNDYLVYQTSEGLVYGADLQSGQARQLTPGGKHFALQPPPVSISQNKVAMVEAPPYSNIWSLDTGTGALTQVTNNDRYQVTPLYLPGSNRILFMEYYPNDHGPSEDICLLNDDGSDFSMLTQDFSFDALGSVSLASGKIAFEHLEDPQVPYFQKAAKSIRVFDGNGNGMQVVAESESSSLTKPVFTDVPGWRQPNQLTASAEIANNGTGQSTLTVNVGNPGATKVDAVLRLFPGDGFGAIKASATADQDTTGNPAASGNVFSPAVKKMEWRLTLAPGESKKFDIDITAGPVTTGIGRGALLVSLTATGAPPVMIWRQVP